MAAGKSSVTIFSCGLGLAFQCSPKSIITFCSLQIRSIKINGVPIDKLFAGELYRPNIVAWEKNCNKHWEQVSGHRHPKLKSDSGAGLRHSRPIGKLGQLG